MNQKPPSQPVSANKMGVGVAIGIGIGAALGVALNNIALGVGLGVGIGVALGVALNWQNNRLNKVKPQRLESFPKLKDSKMSNEITVYGHPTCPNLGPVKGLLTQSKVKFEYIDIHQDSVAAARVRAINNGNESVPTLVFPDGSILTEPTVGELKAKLESLGYKVGLVAWLIGNIWLIFVVAGVLIAVLRLIGIF